MVRNAGGRQGSRNPREGWRAGLGHVLIGLAGGMGVGVLTTDVGWRGAAVVAAAGGILLGAARLRRFPSEAPLVVISSWATWILAAVCTVIAAFVPFAWSGYAVLGAALFAGAATVIPFDRYKAARTLGGIATIGIGVSVMSIAIVFVQLFSDPSMLVILVAGIDYSINPFIGIAVAIIGAAISFIAAGIALLIRRDKLLGVAGVGFGVSLIGGGIVVQQFLGQILGLPVWLIASGAVAAIGAGVAFRIVRAKLLGVASIGLGLALLGVGIFPLAWVRLGNYGVGFGTLLITAGAVAIGSGFVFMFAQGRLLGFAGVGVGLSLISAAIFIWIWYDIAHAIWLIAAGAVAIGSGVVFMFARGRLSSFAGVGLAFSLITAGVVVLIVQNILTLIEATVEAKLVGALTTGIAVGTFLAIGAGVAAIGADVALPFARTTVTGIAGVCLGICLIGTGVLAGGSGLWLLAAWLIFVGVSLIGLAIAHLRRTWRLLGGVAAIGFGISLAVPAVESFLRGSPLGGVALVGAGLALATVGASIIVRPSQAELRTWLRSKWTAWTQAPSRPSH